MLGFWINMNYYCTGVENMSDLRSARTRWKGKDAREIAHGDPVSKMYETMKDWVVPKGLFADSTVLLQVNGQQAQLLSRSCFGRPYPPPESPRVTSVSTYPPPASDEDMQLFQLGAEEAFYLHHSLRCIDIYVQTVKGRILLNSDDLWTLILRSNGQFVQRYKAYSHLRSKRWVVLSGIQYGADFVAYCHHPALVHSDYAVLVKAGERRPGRLSTWTDLHAMQRLCGSVAKILLLLLVIPVGDPAEPSSPTCLEDYRVEAIEVERWVPEKHRETVAVTETSCI